MNWKPWLVTVPIIFLLTATPAASRNSSTGWAVLTTQQGCLYRWAIDTNQQSIAAFEKSGYRYNWSGPCRKGAFIDGEGTMTIKTGGGDPVDTKTGRLVNGVWNGTVRTPDRVSEFNMGCEITRDGLDGCMPIVAKATPAPAVTSATTAAPLRPTIAQEAHNPAGEASDCVRVIYMDDFEVEHVSTTQKAAFRNRCSRPVEVSWCTISGDCRPGYTNLATVPARQDRGFSYEPSIGGSKVAYAACYNGFVRQQGELSKKLLHACK